MYATVHSLLGKAPAPVISYVCSSEPLQENDVLSFGFEESVTVGTCVFHFNMCI